MISIHCRYTNTNTNSMNYEYNDLEKQLPEYEYIFPEKTSSLCQHYYITISNTNDMDMDITNMIDDDCDDDSDIENAKPRRINVRPTNNTNVTLSCMTDYLKQFMKSILYLNRRPYLQVHPNRERNTKNQIMISY